MPEAPQTDEGWYALHDFRTVDWDAWRDAPERERERATESGVEYLQAHESLADTDGEDGGSAVFTVLGDKADLLILHLRPTTTQLDTAERRFEQTAFARFTEQTASYVSVTEVSGYMSQEYFEGESVEDTGMARYIRSRIEPDIPDSEHVCFYPMDKRRGEQDNWYDLPFEERADLMSNHGEIGREYAGKVTQIITGSIGFDDYEWGVTLFADDPTEIKHLLYEMRFDPSSSRYAEFGSFYFGRRFDPADLDAVLAGEPIEWSATSDDSDAADGGELAAELNRLGVSLDAPADTAAHAVVVPCETGVEELTEAVGDLRGNFEHYDSHLETTVHNGDPPTVLSTWTTESAADTAAGFLADLPGATETLTGSSDTSGSGDNESNDQKTASTSDDLRSELASLDIYAGQPHGEDVHAMVLYSSAPTDELQQEVADLSDGFDRYDTHVETSVYRARNRSRSAVVSLWETEDSAETAGSYLADLPEIVTQPGETETDGFGTMGMFYAVKPDYREEFLETFEEVGDVLAGMDGHRETDLMINTADENDMFIASQWRSKEDAMTFFRSDAFQDTVEWGRDVLTDRPRHVFLA